MARASGDARCAGPEDEQAALAASKLFTDYLRASRDERFAMSLLPPGRFLMPGDLAGSPALTFAPLDLPETGEVPDGSLWAMMRRRFDAYRSAVVQPFFRDHFSLLDRQIVLVDALAAFNAGPEAVRDLEGALAGILDCFRVGQRVVPEQSRAAEDRQDSVRRDQGRSHAPHEPRPARGDPAAHDEARGGARAIRGRGDRRGGARRRAGDARGDREARTRQPAFDPRRARRGRKAGGETFDGETETAIFPGDLPEDPDALFDGKGAFRGLASGEARDADFRFLKFRPPACWKRRLTARPPCRIFASTARCNS
jgi:uncharacterized protein